VVVITPCPCANVRSLPLEILTKSPVFVTCMSPFSVQSAE
jgi:hypothetical protein